MSEPWVAKVNGEPVSVRLFERRMAGNRAHAYRYFGRKYGAEDSADFWTASYDGEVPLAWLKQRALEECVRIKVEQMVARGQGVIENISYAGFLDALARENERRRQALAAGEPIYGPQQYGEDEYFVYSFSNMVIESKRRLGRGELAPSEEALREYYERNKDKLYERGDCLTVWEVSIPFGRQDGLSREEARAKIEEVKARLEAGERFEDLARRYNEAGSLGERTMDDETARFDEQARPLMRREAMKLREGEVSGVFEEQGALHIIMCVAREELGCLSFEEAAGNVRQRYLDEKYEEMIAGLVGRAEVKVNQSVYDEVAAR